MKERAAAVGELVRAVRGTSTMQMRELMRASLGGRRSDRHQFYLHILAKSWPKSNGIVIHAYIELRPSPLIAKYVACCITSQHHTTQLLYMIFFFEMLHGAANRATCYSAFKTDVNAAF